MPQVKLIVIVLILGNKCGLIKNWRLKSNPPYPLYILNYYYYTSYMNYYNVGDAFRRYSFKNMVGEEVDSLCVIDSIETTPNYFLDTKGPMYRIKFKVYKLVGGVSCHIGNSFLEVRSLDYCQDDLYIKGDWSFKNKKLKKLSLV